MDNLPISDILVTQDDLRNYAQMRKMIAFAKTGYFDEVTLGSYAIRHNLPKAAPRIEIARFEDGVMAIHNGHHRAISIFMGRKLKELHPTEFFIKEWKYKDYTDIVLPYWVTPFHPMNEIRLYELGDWKEEVRKFYILHGDKATEQFILENKHRYAISRGNLYTVGDLASKVRDKL